VQAANDSLGASERADIQSQLLELNGEVNDIAENAEFNGKKLLNGGGSGSNSQDLQFQVGAQNGDDFSVSLNSAQASDIGIESDSRNQILFEGGFDATGASLGGSEGTKAPNEFDIEVQATNVNTGSTSASYSVSVQTAGGETASTTGVSISTYTSSSTTIGLTTGTSGTTSGALTANTDTTAASGLNVSISSDQLTELANEEGSGSLTAFSTKSNLDVSNADSAQEAISTVDSGISSVTDQLASIGDAQTRLDFKEGNLETTRTNLESARSQIEDADFAREQTRVAKLQILQQTGTAQLAQANAASQSVLSLVGG
jgi:flagellin